MTEQFVYFIQDIGRNCVKIGFTANVQERVKTLQTGNPTELRLLGYIRGGRAKEREFHTRLEQHRLQGEWFSLDPVIDLMRDLPVEQWVYLRPNAQAPRWKKGAKKRWDAAKRHLRDTNRL